MVKVIYSKAHGDKLSALLSNSKLPMSDFPRVKVAIERYNSWIKKMDTLTTVGDDLLVEMVSALNEYKNFLEYNLIFCSEDDFLYRQKGQLKLDNTVLEEFLPRLFDARLVPGFARLKGIECGPKKSFSGLSFDSPFLSLSDGGAFIKCKDQDFSVTKSHKITITAPHEESDKYETNVHVSYFATEIKTNLDKTMFQEASHTANELKRAVSGSKYILLCEWLDMTPINTKLTPIDEVIVLRKAKRISSNIRSDFSDTKDRKKNAKFYEEFLNKNPLSIDCFRRFIHHLQECFPNTTKEEDDLVLNRGYF